MQSLSRNVLSGGFWIPSRGWFQVLFLYMTERSYFWQTRSPQCPNLAVSSLAPMTVTQGGLRCGLRNTLTVAKLQRACGNYIIQETIYGLAKDSYWCWVEMPLRCGNLEPQSSCMRASEATSSGLFCFFLKQQRWTRTGWVFPAVGHGVKEPYT